MALLLSSARFKLIYGRTRTAALLKRLRIKEISNSKAAVKTNSFPVYRRSCSSLPIFMVLLFMLSY